MSSSRDAAARTRVSDHYLISAVKRNISMTTPLTHTHTHIRHVPTHVILVISKDHTHTLGKVKHISHSHRRGNKEDMSEKRTFLCSPAEESAAALLSLS